MALEPLGEALSPSAAAGWLPRLEQDTTMRPASACLPGGVSNPGSLLTSHTEQARSARGLSSGATSVTAERKLVDKCLSGEH